MGRFLFTYTFLWCLAFAVPALEVIIDPYAGLEDVPKDALLVFDYEVACDPCIEVWEAENGQYEGQNTAFEDYPKPQTIIFTFPDYP